MPKWTIEEAREHYNIRGWGAGYFDINAKGNIVVRPNRKNKHDIDLKNLVDDIQSKGYSLPVLIRFSDILKASIANLANSFQRSSMNTNIMVNTTGISDQGQPAKTGC
ncbi:MAG: hypothetical protein CM1200mP16_17060 [Nitrospina sp.]|nr:MAG: hypothetical protein CM1200mP16_17060 [Nitrospina sp.]